MSHFATIVLGIVIGLLLNVTTTERHNLDTWKGKSKEGILLYIGYDEDVKGGPWFTNANFINPPLASKWNEVLVKRYKSKEDAVKARDEALKSIGEK